MQVREDQEEEDAEVPQGEKNVNEAVNGALTSSPSSMEKAKLKYPEPATPGNSPARGVTMPSPAAPTGTPKLSYSMKHSDSSFGLHSPDSFNDDVQVIIPKSICNKLVRKKGMNMRQTY